MDLFVEFFRTAVKFIFMIAVCTGGVFAGIALRKKKNASQETNE